MHRKLVERPYGLALVGPLFLVLFVSATVAPDARADDLARRGSFGAAIRLVTAGEREKQKLKDENNVIVDHVSPESSAALAGLQPGDILVSLDGKAIASPSQFIERSEERRVGKEC